MLGSTYLRARRPPQHEHPSRRLLDPTVQFSSKSLASKGFVASKKKFERKERKKKKKGKKKRKKRNFEYENGTLSLIPSDETGGSQ